MIQRTRQPTDNCNMCTFKPCAEELPEATEPYNSNSITCVHQQKWEERSSWHSPKLELAQLSINRGRGRILHPERRGSASMRCEVCACAGRDMCGRQRPGDGAREATENCGWLSNGFPARTRPLRAPIMDPAPGPHGFPTRMYASA